MIAKLAATKLALSHEDALKRAPRGFEDVSDPDIAMVVRLKHFICLRPVSAAAIRKPALVDSFCSFASDSLPLLQWGWNAIVDVR